MPLNPFLKPLSLTIKPSLQKWLIIIVPHLLGLLLITSIDMFPLWSKFIIGVFITLSFTYYYQYHIALKLKKSVVLIQQDSVKNWFITLSNNTNNNDPKSVNLLPSSFKSKLFIVLNFQDNNGSYYRAIILPDSISSINFKHLYIELNTTYIK